MITLHNTVKSIFNSLRAPLPRKTSVRLPSSPRRLTRRRLPPIRYLPLRMTIILPIRRRDNLLLPSNKRLDGAHAVLLLRAALDTDERDRAVVDDDADLAVVEVGAVED